MSAVVKRFWMPVAAGGALVYLVIMLLTGALPERRHLVTFEPHGVLQLEPEDITRVTVTEHGTSAVFVRQAHGWSRKNSTAAIQAPLTTTLDQAVKFMHTATPVRVFKPEDMADTDMALYGLERPRLSITLENARGVVLVADFGNRSNDGLLRYMRLRDRGEVYMMSGFVGQAWERVATAIRP
jgi:hypothetical protein